MDDKQSSGRQGLRTPEDVAFSVTLTLRGAYAPFVQRGAENAFYELVGREFKEDDGLLRGYLEDGAATAHSRHNFHGDSSLRGMAIVGTCLVMAGGAVRAYQKGSIDQAWSSAVTAAVIASAVTAICECSRDARVELARAGADAHHKENRAMKQDVIAAFLRGNYASKDDAAAKLAGILVPVKFRTVRDWLKGVEKDA